MKKRILATFLSLCMVIGMLPTVAFAEEVSSNADVEEIIVAEEPATNGSASTEEPTADGSASTEEPTADGNASTEEPTANGSASTEEPTADGSASTEEPTADGSASTEEPTADGSASIEEPTANDVASSKNEATADEVDATEDGSASVIPATNSLSVGDDGVASIADEGESDPVAEVSSLLDPSFYLAGSGTYEDPYQIWSIDEFALINTYPSYSYKQMANLDFAGATDFTGSTYITEIFTGDYDGNGYEMQNVEMPIFSYVQGDAVATAEEFMNYDPENYQMYYSSILENITVVDSDVIYSGSLGTTGVIACYTANVMVYNCAMEGGTFYGGSTAAGIVGFGLASAIENCYNSGEIRATGGYRACGIVGVMAPHYSGIAVLGATSGVIIVSNCVNDGTLYGVTNNYGMGGVVGKIENPLTSAYNSPYEEVPIYILNCTNNGNLNVTVNGNQGYVGGIVGYVQHYGLVIDGCTNNGDIISVGASELRYVGGIIGCSVKYGTYFDETSFTITNCTNTGDILATATISGGVVGVAGNLEMSDCDSTGDISNSIYQSDAVGGLTELNADYTPATYVGALVVPSGETLASGSYIGVSSLTVEEGGVVGDITLDSTNLTIYNSGIIGDITAGAAVTVNTNSGTIGDITSGTGAITIGKSATEDTGNEGAIGNLTATAANVIIYRNTGDIGNVNANTTITVGEGNVARTYQINSGSIGSLTAQTTVAVYTHESEGSIGDITSKTSTVTVGNTSYYNHNHIGVIRSGTTVVLYNEGGTIGDITSGTTATLYNEGGTIGDITSGTTVSLYNEGGEIDNITSGTNTAITYNTGAIGTVTATNGYVYVGVSKNTGETSGNVGETAEIGDITASGAVNIYRNTGVVGKLTAGTSITIGQSGADYVDIQTNAGTIGSLKAGTTIAIYATTAGNIATGVGDSIVFDASIDIGSAANPNGNTIGDVTYREGTFATTDNDICNGTGTIGDITVNATLDINIIQNAGKIGNVTNKLANIVVATNTGVIDDITATTSISVTTNSGTIQNITAGTTVTVTTSTDTIGNIIAGTTVSIPNNSGSINDITSGTNTTIIYNTGTIGTVIATNGYVYVGVSKNTGETSGNVGETAEIGDITASAAVNIYRNTGVVGKLTAGTSIAIGQSGASYVDIQTNAGTIGSLKAGTSIAIYATTAGNIAVEEDESIVFDTAINIGSAANPNGNTIGDITYRDGTFATTSNDICNGTGTIGDITANSTTDITIVQNAGKIGNVTNKLANIVVTANTGEIDDITAATSISVTTNAGVLGELDAITSVSVTNSGTVGTVAAGTTVSVPTNSGTIGNISGGTTAVVTANSNTIGNITSGTNTTITYNTGTIGTVTAANGYVYVGAGSNTSETSGSVGETAKIGDITASGAVNIYRNTGAVGKLTAGTSIAIGQSGAKYVDIQTNAGTIGSLKAGTTIVIYATTAGNIATGDGDSIVFDTSINIGSSTNLNGNTIGDITYREGTLSTEDNDIYNGTGTIGDITVNSTLDINIIQNAGKIGNVTNELANIVVTANAGEIDDITAATTVGVTTNSGIIASITADGNVTVCSVDSCNTGAITNGVTSSGSVTGYSTIYFTVNALSNLVVFNSDAASSEDGSNEKYIHTTGGTIYLTVGTDADEGKVFVKDSSDSLLHTYPAGVSPVLNLTTNTGTVYIGEGVIVDTVMAISTMTVHNNGTVNTISGSTTLTISTNTGVIGSINGCATTTISSNTGKIENITFTSSGTQALTVTNDQGGTITGAITKASGTGAMKVENYSTTPLECDITNNTGLLTLTGNSTSADTALFTGAISTNGSLTLNDYLGTNVVGDAITVTLLNNATIIADTAGFYLSVQSDATALYLNMTGTTNGLNTVDVSGCTALTTLGGSYEEGTTIVGFEPDSTSGSITVGSAATYTNETELGALALTNTGDVTLTNYGTIDSVEYVGSDILTIINHGVIGNVSAPNGAVIVSENVTNSSDTEEISIGNITAKNAITISENDSEIGILTAGTTATVNTNSGTIGDITSGTGVITIGKSATEDTGNEGTIGNLTATAANVIIYRNTGGIGNVIANTTIAVGEGNVARTYQINSGSIGSLTAQTAVTVYTHESEGSIGDITSNTSTVTIGNTSYYNHNHIGDITAGTIVTLYNEGSTIGDITAGTTVSIPTNSGSISDITSGTNTTITYNTGTIGTVIAKNGYVYVGEDENTSETSGNVGETAEIGNITASGAVNIYRNTGVVGKLTAGTSIAIGQSGAEYVDIQTNAGTIGSLKAGTTIVIYATTAGNIATGDGDSIVFDTSINIGSSTNLNGNTIGDITYREGALATTDNDIYNGTGTIGDITVNSTTDITIAQNAGKIGNVTNKLANIVVAANAGKIDDITAATTVGVTTNSGTIQNITAGTTATVTTNSGTIRDITAGTTVTVTTNTDTIGNIVAGTTVSIPTNSGSISNITSGTNTTITYNTGTIGTVIATNGYVYVGAGNNTSETSGNVGETAKIGDITASAAVNIYRNTGVVGKLTAGTSITIGQSGAEYVDIQTNAGTIGSLKAGTSIAIYATTAGNIAVEEDESIVFDTAINIGSAANLNGNTIGDITYREGTFSTDDNDIYNGTGTIGDITVNSTTDITIAQNAGKIGNVTNKLANIVVTANAGKIDDITAATTVGVTTNSDTIRDITAGTTATVTTNSGTIRDITAGTTVTVTTSTNTIGDIAAGTTVSIPNNSGEIDNITAGSTLTIGSAATQDTGEYGDLTANGTTTLHITEDTTIDSVTVNDSVAFTVNNYSAASPDTFTVTTKGSVTNNAVTTYDSAAAPAVLSVVATSSTTDSVVTQTLTGAFEKVTKTGDGTLVIAASTTVNTLVIATGATNDVVYLGDVDTSIVPDDTTGSTVGSASTVVTATDYIYRTSLTEADGVITLSVSSYALDSETYVETLGTDENLTNIAGQIAVVDDYGNPVDFTVDGSASTDGIYQLDYTAIGDTSTYELGSILIEEYGYFTITFTQGVATSGENTRSTTTSSCGWENVTLLSNADVVFTLITSQEELDANANWASLNGTYEYPALVVEVLISTGIDDTDVTYTVAGETSSPALISLEDAESLVAGDIISYTVVVEKEGYDTCTETYDYTVSAADVAAMQPDLTPITFELLGGTGIVTDGNYEPGTVITLPDTPVRENYTFYGWSANMQTLYLANSSYTVSEEDVVFYAIWRATEASVTTYTLSIDSSYESIISGASNLQEFIAGTEIVLTISPTSRQTFYNWVVTGTDSYTENGKVLTLRMDADTTVSAKISTSVSSTETSTTTTSGYVDDGVITATTKTTSGVTSTTVTESIMESAIDSADGDTIEIVVNTKSTTDTVSVILSNDALETFISNGMDTLEISSSLGCVTIPSDAAQSIVSQADGNTITIVVKEVDADAELNAAQQAQIGDGVVIDVTIMSGGVPIAYFGGEEILIAIPYELKDGESAENIEVWYIADDGTITVMDSVYDGDNEMAVFATNHLSVYAVVHNDNMFTDVSTDAYYYDAVLWAVANGITSGTTDTTFSPTNSCTRAQAVTFLWRAAGCPEATIENPFADVLDGAYYYDAVLWAVENGITTGYSDGTFRPNTTCNRGAIVTFLYRFAGEPKVSGEATSDVADGAYYYDAVLWAIENGITTGYDDGTFRPTTTCNRGAIVTFLYRYLA